MMEFILNLIEAIVGIFDLVFEPIEKGIVTIVDLIIALF